MVFLCGVVAWYEGLAIGFVAFGLVVFFVVKYGGVVGSWKRNWRFGLVWVVLVGLAFGGGIARSWWAQAVWQEKADMVVGKGTVTVIGEVGADPSDGSFGLRARLNVEGVGVVEVVVPTGTEIGRGDIVSARGKVSIQELYGVSHLIMQPVQILSISLPIGFLGMIATGRKNFVGRMQELFPGSVGGFMIGILAGGAMGISQDVVQDFRRTGLSHILAVSGYNVSLLLELGIAVIPVKRKYRFAVFGSLLLIFIIFVGFQASAIRAAIMGFFGVFAASLGRPKDMLLILLWTAFIMVAYDPTMLLFDKGFQLSFMATVGVMYVAPPIQSLFPDSKKFSSELFTSFIATFAVYLALIPVTLSFGKFPIIGLITNLIFVSFVPIAMALAAGLYALSFLFYPLAFILSRLTTYIVNWYFAGIHFFSFLPFSVFDAQPMSNWSTLIYYAVLTFWVLRRTF